MEQIIIQIENKEKAKLLMDLLTSLDFIESVKTWGQEDLEMDGRFHNPIEGNFFELKGLWSSRDVSLEDIRRKAWPRNINDTL